MVRFIGQYLWPLIKKFKHLFIAMIAISTLGVVLLMSCVNAVENVRKTADDYIDNYHFPDVCLTLDKEIGSDLDFAVQSLEGVEKVEKRFSHDINGKDGDKFVSYKVISYEADQLIRPYFKEEIAFKEGEVNIYLDDRYAKENDVKPGDYLTVRPTPDLSLECHVQKLFHSTECIYSLPNEMATPNKYTFAFVYVNVAELENESVRLFLEQKNQFIIQTNEGANNEEILEKVKTLASSCGYKVLDSYTRGTASTFKFIENYQNSLEAISVIVPSAFFTITVIISFLFLMQIIKSESKEIGIMMTLGISKTKIFVLLAVFTVLISIFSLIFGILLSIPMTSLVQSVMLSGNILPYSMKFFDVGLFFIVLGITIVSGQLATFLASFLLVKMTPLECMNANEELSLSIGAFRGRILGRLPNFTKLVYSLIVSNKRRLATSIFAYIASFILIFLSMSVISSENYLVESYRNDRLNYDVQIMIVDDPFMKAKDDLLSFDVIEKIEEVHISEFSVGYKEKTYAAIAASLEEGHEFVVVRDTKKNIIPYFEDGIVLESFCASYLDADIGDFVTVNGHQLKVQGISYQGSNKIQIMSPSQMEKLELPAYRAYFAKCSDRNKLLEHLFTQDYSAFCTFSEDQIKQVENDCLVHQTVSSFIIVFAIAIGFVIIYLMNQSSFLEQKRKLSIMRLLGYQSTQIGVLWLFQFLIQFLLSLILSIPGGILVSLAVLNAMTSDLFSYPFINNPLAYLISTGFIIVFYLIVHVITIQTVRKLNIADNTRSRE